MYKYIEHEPLSGHEHVNRTRTFNWSSTARNAGWQGAEQARGTRCAPASVLGVRAAAPTQGTLSILWMHA